MVVLALLAAGCTSTPDADDATSLAAASTGGEPASPLGLAATGCFEGGGHSVHPIMFNPLPEPWVPADVLSDVGPQLLYSEVPDPMRPIPEEGNTMGNYHATVWCEGWTLDGAPLADVLFGFVGMKVEPPPFDVGSEPATHHYLVTVIATSDDDILARLQAAGIAALKATGEQEVLPGGTLRVRMWTDGNGDYDSIFKPQEMGPSKAARVRLWWQGGYGHGDHAAQGAEGYRPIALDMVNAGGTHYTAEGQGYFSHSGTDHHAPLPGAHGQAAALMYDGFDRVFEFGPRPDITIAQAYDH